MARIFISYNRVDKAITKRLADLLSHAYDHVWYDTARLVGGDEWWAKIVAEIQNCDHFIYLLSPESVASEWCQKELAEAQKLGKHIIPVRVRARTDTPEALKKIHCIDMFEDVVTVEGINQIYAALIRNSVELITVSDEQKQHSDLRVLKLIWPFIESRKILLLSFEVKENNIHIHKKNFNKILHYLFLRMQAENHCFDTEIEIGLAELDIALATMGIYVTEKFEISRENDEEFWVPVKAGEKGNEEIKATDERELLSLLKELQAKHNVLVEKIRIRIPTFDFKGEK
jgi:hypothetical protein